MGTIIYGVHHYVSILLPHPPLRAGRVRRLIDGILPRRPGFNPRSGHLGFVVDKMALGQGFLRALRPSAVTISLLVCILILFL